MQDYIIENGCLTMYEARGWIVRVPKEVTEIGANVFREAAILGLSLPDGLQRIGDSAFAQVRSLDRMRVPDSVREIAPFAFSRSSLREITLPRGLREIPDGMCCGCPELTEIVIPEGVESIGVRAFAMCPKLRTVRLPKSLRRIARDAFSGCPLLAEIEIPSGVTAIERNTFGGCGALQTIVIPDTVSCVDPHAFDGCGALQGFAVDADNPCYCSDEAGALIRRDGTLLRYPYAGPQAYTAPDFVKAVAEDAFSGCKTLCSVVFPDYTVVTIGDGAFSNCKRLQRARFGKGLRQIGAAAFAFSTRLQEVRFDGGVRELPDSLFSGCSALHDVTLPYDLLRMGECVFEGCRSIEQIELPEKLNTIGEQCFYGCTKLTAFVVPLHVKELPDSVFYGCRSLETIRLPSGLEAIREGAFGRCSALRTVRFAGSRETRQKMDVRESWNKRLLDAEWTYELDEINAAYARFREQREWNEPHMAVPPQGCGRTREEIFHDAILGLVVGDAVGVPYESAWRDSYTAADMVAVGQGASTCHHGPIPCGSWSDDSCMTFATVDHLRSCDVSDTEDLMRRFCAWFEADAYTPKGQKRFGEGRTTTRALQTFRSGTPADACGLAEETALGNGSLMRILPLAFFGHSPQQVAQISAVTHAHPLAVMACVCYIEVAEKLIEGKDKADAVREIRWPDCGAFARMATIETCSRDEIKSSCHVIETLEAALWCLLTTQNYRDCILTAVNLGRDTDTVAAVAGGLAGICYAGEKGIPAQWIEKLQPGYEDYIRPEKN